MTVRARRVAARRRLRLRRVAGHARRLRRRRVDVPMAARARGVALCGLLRVARRARLRRLPRVGLMARRARRRRHVMRLLRVARRARRHALRTVRRVARDARLPTHRRVRRLHLRVAAGAGRRRILRRSMRIMTARAVLVRLHRHRLLGVAIGARCTLLGLVRLVAREARAALMALCERGPRRMAGRARHVLLPPMRRVARGARVLRLRVRRRLLRVTARALRGDGRARAVRLVTRETRRLHVMRRRVAVLALGRLLHPERVTIEARRFLRRLAAMVRRLLRRVALHADARRRLLVRARVALRARDLLVADVHPMHRRVARVRPRRRDLLHRRRRLRPRLRRPPREPHREPDPHQEHERDERATYVGRHLRTPHE